MKYINLTALIIFFSTSIYPLSVELSLGKNSAWEKIELHDNTELYPGNEGYLSLGLASSVYDTDDSTDLLIHFDNSQIYDTADNYSIEPGITVTDRKMIIGNGSGVFRGEENSLILTPGKGSIFSGGQLLDSFSIEFWLNPARLGNKPVILSYRSTFRNGSGGIIPQELSCFLTDQKITWGFTNFFYMDGRQSDVKLSGLSTIIPGIWHHHLLRFDGSSGLIEYLIDGNLEAVRYSSNSGNEDGTIHYPMISPIGNPKLLIGSNYTGYMDELRITKAFIQNPVLYRYQDIIGRAESAVIDLGRSDSRLEKIIIENYIPKDSAVFYSYAISDNLAELYNIKDWNIFPPNEWIINNNRGRFLRVKIEIHPDGDELLTPLISDVKIRYEENLRPLAPENLEAESRNGSIYLFWPKTMEPDVEGYLLYYGTEKGRYFGSDAEEGHSPLIIKSKDINNLEIHGLQNEKLYHFAIAAFDGAGTEDPGKFSREITCRPVASGNN